MQGGISAEKNWVSNMVEKFNEKVFNPSFGGLQRPQAGLLLLNLFCFFLSHFLSFWIQYLKISSTIYLRLSSAGGKFQIPFQAFSKPAENTRTHQTLWKSDICIFADVCIEYLSHVNEEHILQEIYFVDAKKNG